jgi:hypothetical protein
MLPWYAITQEILGVSKKRKKRNYENAWRLNRFEGYPNLWTNPAAGRL